MTEKFLFNVSADVVAFRTPPAAMLIRVGVKLPMSCPLTLAFVKLILPKLASGRTAPPAVQHGAS